MAVLVLRQGGGHGLVDLLTHLGPVLLRRGGTGLLFGWRLLICRQRQVGQLIPQILQQGRHLVGQLIELIRLTGQADEAAELGVDVRRGRG